MLSISGKNLIRDFLRALSRALTGPLPSAAVCSNAPSESSTFMLASVSMSPRRLSIRILNPLTVNLGSSSPLSLLTRSSKLASAPSNWYPLDSISLIFVMMSEVSSPHSRPSSFSFSRMLALPAISDTRIFLLFPTREGSMCSYVRVSFVTADMCMPPLWVNAISPT